MKVSGEVQRARKIIFSFVAAALMDANQVVLFKCLFRCACAICCFSCASFLIVQYAQCWACIISGYIALTMRMLFVLKPEATGRGTAHDQLLNPTLLLYGMNATCHSLQLELTWLTLKKYIAWQEHECCHFHAIRFLDNALRANWRKG